MTELKHIKQQTYLDTYYFSNSNDKKIESIYLLLHGYNQHGKFIFDTLKDICPKNALIIAPNGIFPIMTRMKSYYKKRYIWYFYDDFKKTYDISPEAAARCLGGLLDHLNKASLPVTIIGFSQGGFLAPYIKSFHDKVKTVIGIGCVYRELLKDYNLNFTLHAIHGTEDKIVDYKRAKLMFQQLAPLTFGGQFLTIPNGGHQINRLVKMKISELI